MATKINEAMHFIAFDPETLKTKDEDTDWNTLLTRNHGVKNVKFGRVMPIDYREEW